MTDRPKRMQTQTERDLSGMQARKERAATSPVVAEMLDDITGRYEGEELAVMRSKRDTHDRIARVEMKQDRQGLAIAKMEGSLEQLVDYARRDDEREARKEALREAAEQRAENRRAMWRKLLPTIIAAIGTAIAGIIAATH